MRNQYDGRAARDHDKQCRACRRWRGYRCGVYSRNRLPQPPDCYRFFFYSFDCNEPMHVHVRRERATCKFWLAPLALASGTGFSPRELTRIRSIILEYRRRIREAWREHCGEAQ